MIILMGILLIVVGFGSAFYFFCEKDEIIPAILGLFMMIGGICMFAANSTYFNQSELKDINEKVSKACDQNKGLQEVGLFGDKINYIKCKNGAKFRSKAVKNL